MRDHPRDDSVFRFACVNIFAYALVSLDRTLCKSIALGSDDIVIISEKDVAISNFNIKLSNLFQTRLSRLVSYKDSC